MPNNCIEASPKLYGQITTTPLIEKYNYAIAGNDGIVTFHESNNIEAGNIIGPKANSTGNTVDVDALNFASLVAQLDLADIDLVKMDIEGAEIQLFESIDEQHLSRIQQLSLEFHNAVPILNVSLESVNRVIGKIKSMGFDGLPFAPNHLDWLFWRKAGFECAAPRTTVYAD